MSEPDEGLPLGLQIQAVLNEALTKVLSEKDNSYAIKWVAAVEVMQNDGQRAVWTFATPDATRWDINGLVNELVVKQLGTTIAGIIREMNG